MMLKQAIDTGLKVLDLIWPSDANREVVFTRKKYKKGRKFPAFSFWRWLDAFRTFDWLTFKGRIEGFSRTTEVFPSRLKHV
jgi:hypothetical protein